MKRILRTTLINTLALYLISAAISGFVVDGGLLSYLVGGFALALLFIFLKPLISFISFPLNAVTLGAFSVLGNVLIFYLLTVFVQDIQVTAFTFSGWAAYGFKIPSIDFNVFFTFVIVSVLQSLIVNFVAWLMHK